VFLARGERSRPGRAASLQKSESLVVTTPALNWRNNEPFVWLDADDCPNLAQATDAFVRLNELDRFSWEYFRLDRDNAESWEFVG
jgi:hypothetical protein